MQNAKLQQELDLAEKTVADLARLKGLIATQREALNAEMLAIDQRILLHQRRVADLQSGAGKNGKTARLRKGEGIASILEVLNPLNGLGMSQAQITEKTGISGSTVWRLLKQNPDKVEIGVDNLWRKRV